MLYKLEVLQKEVHQAIQVQYVRILQGLNGSRAVGLFDVSDVLRRVDLAVSNVITGHQKKVIHEQQIDSTRVALEREIRNLKYECANRENRIRTLKDRVQRRDEKLDEWWKRSYRERQERVSLEQEIIRLKFKLESQEKNHRAALLYRPDLREQSATDKLHKKIDELRLEVEDYKQFLSFGLPEEDGYLDRVPSFSDTINEDPVTPEESYEYRRLCEILDLLLSTLRPREEMVLRLLYGIGRRSDHTCSEVARMYGVTRERIRQIELRALRKLKHRGWKFRPFLDTELPGGISPDSDRHVCDTNLPADPTKTAKARAKKKSGRRKGQVLNGSKEQMTISLLRKLLKDRHRVPHREFMRMTGVKISAGQYARCLRTVQMELGTYRPKGVN